MIGSQIGKYRVAGLIAMGGMGEVWLATQTGPGGFERRVVVKRVLRQLAYDPEFVRLFLEEARLAALLSHPNVVQVFELGEEAGEYFIAMEFVRGVTFRALLMRLKERHRQLPQGMVAMLGAGVAHALHAAHTLVDSNGSPVQLVHRDVSPDNLMLSVAGQVKVLDFGVAKALARGSPKTLVVRGKVPYLAPEQLSEGLVSPQSDIYSLGVVLRELSGDPATTPLDPLIERATRPQAQTRFETALVMATELERVASSLGAPGAAALAGLVGELFPERLREELPEVRPPTAVISKAPAAAAPVLAEEPRELPRRRFPWTLLLVVVAVTGGAVGAVALRTPEPTSVAGSTPTHETADPPRLPPPTPSPLPEPPRSETTVDAEEPTLTPNAPRKGRVNLLVAPWAEVFFQGKSLGVTPLEQPIELPAGSHVLLLKNPKVGIEKKVTVYVRGGAVSTVTVDLLR